METDCSDAQEFEEESIQIESIDPSDHEVASKRRNSFVWRYYKQLEGSDLYECKICGSCVGNLTSNLARHLFTSHNLTKNGYQSGEADRTIRGRPSRSFIWKYCTKEDAKHARCHSCKKLLYFGGGNTANIAKHLRRKHPDIINNKERGKSTYMDEANETTTSIAAMDGDSEDLIENGTDTIKIKNEICLPLPRERRERKGSSYVWSYCDKLSRHTIRCKLCKKIMSFHGTANVITHLQRRHNIIGRVDYPSNTSVNDDDKNSLLETMDESNESTGKRRRRTFAGTSIVWKYCTRIETDVVRCSFCKKNLSFQGTSNLQRHLHRMHGVVTQGRVFSEAEQLTNNVGDDTFIWEYCSQNDDDEFKCSMCTFKTRDIAEISKHLRVTHAIQPQGPVKRRRRRRPAKSQDEDTSDEDFDEYDIDTDDVNANDRKWSKRAEEGYLHASNETVMKKESSIFDDIIEEDLGEQCDEDLFDPNAAQDYPIANPLSPESSPGASPHRVQNAFAKSKQLQKLNEERVRMETEYFREKAGFYRMQKYLTALQAKKVRVEIERFNNTELNGVAYTLNVDIPEDAIHTQ